MQENRQDNVDYGEEEVMEITEVMERNQSRLEQCASQDSVERCHHHLPSAVGASFKLDTQGHLGGSTG